MDAYGVHSLIHAVSRVDSDLFTVMNALEETKDILQRHKSACLDKLAGRGKNRIAPTIAELNMDCSVYKTFRQLFKKKCEEYISNQLYEIADNSPVQVLSLLETHSSSLNTSFFMAETKENILKQIIEKCTGIKIKTVKNFLKCHWSKSDYYPYLNKNNELVMYENDVYYSRKHSHKVTTQIRDVLVVPSSEDSKIAVMIQYDAKHFSDRYKWNFKATENFWLIDGELIHQNARTSSKLAKKLACYEKPKAFEPEMEEDSTSWCVQLDDNHSISSDKDKLAVYKDDRNIYLYDKQKQIWQFALTERTYLISYPQETKDVRYFKLLKNEKWYPLCAIIGKNLVKPIEEGFKVQNSKELEVTQDSFGLNL